MKVQLILLLYGVLLCPGIIFCKSITIEFGGGRKAKAVVQKLDDGYRCSVSFVPVGCFDAVTNKKINCRKGRAYAMKAFAMFIGVKDGVIIVEEMVATQGLRLQNRRVTIDFAAANVRNAPESVIKQQSKGRTLPVDDKGAGQNLTVEKFVGSLLECKDDYLATLKGLDDILAALVSSLTPDDLDDKVAGIEGQGLDTLDIFSSKVSAEILLLDYEKEQVLQSINKSRKEFIRSLKEAYLANQKPDDS